MRCSIPHERFPRMTQMNHDEQTRPGLLVAAEGDLGLPGNPAPDGKRERYYRPELDVLRCVAFLMVFTSHIPATGNTPSGFSLLGTVEESGATGVCVFFTLSAFLITELLLREREETGVIHRAAFYIRRILRIWPLYFVAVAISIAVPFVYHRWVAPLHFVLPYLLFSGNIATSALGAYPRNGMLAPLWSISVEEQFYLLWALLLFWKGRSGAWFAILGILPVAWAVDLLIPWHGGARDPNLWTNSLSQFQYFALGALVSLHFHRRPVHLSRLSRVAMLAGAGVFLFLAADPFHFLFSMAPERPVTMLAGYLCNDAACILLLVGILDARMPRFANPLRYLGKISYGMYVFHYTLWIGMAAVVVRLLHHPLGAVLPELYVAVLALTIGISALSYQYFEKPFLRLKQHFSFVLSRPT
jgi:peptidoglycan/LPS O-acetylase OafA/YrhL